VAAHPRRRATRQTRAGLRLDTQGALAGMPASALGPHQGRRYGKSVTIATQVVHIAATTVQSHFFTAREPSATVPLTKSSARSRPVPRAPSCSGTTTSCECALRKGTLPGADSAKKWWTSQCTANARATRSSSSSRRGAVARRCSWPRVDLAESLRRRTRRINRVDDYRRLIANLHRHGIAVHLGIMFGSIRTTSESSAAPPSFLDERVRRCRDSEHGRAHARNSNLPSPGAEGRILDDDWSKYDGKKHCVFAPALMSRPNSSRDRMGCSPVLFAAIHRPSPRGLPRGSVVEPSAECRLHACGLKIPLLIQGQ
jgi:hypothetical protein